MSLILQGSTSGSVTLQEPAVAGTTVLTLPAVSGTILTTASSGQSIPRAALPIGSVLQVVQGTPKVNAFTTTSSSPVDVTGLSVNITPTSASNRILVLVQIFGGSDSTTGFYVNLVRNSTSLNISTAGSGVGNSTAGSYFNSGSLWSTYPIVFLDSPATTSSTTYKIQLFNSNGSGTLAVNRRADDAVVGGSSTITVMEIAA